MKLPQIFVLGIVLMSSGQAASADTSSLQLDFVSLHRQYLSQYGDEIEAQSVSGDASRYYSTSYFLHGMLSAVEASQEEVLLQKVIHYIDNMLGKAKDLNGDGHLEWGPLDRNGRPVQLHMFQAVGPIARAAALIMNNPTFKFKYSTAAQRYIHFVDDSTMQYWHIGVYKSRIPCLSSIPWSDKCSLFGLMAASLYRATGNSLYLDIATKVAEAFKSRLVPYGAGWIWDNGTVPLGYGGSQDVVPDTSHANREPMMMVFMHEAGIVFTREDLQQVARTLTDTIWNGSSVNPLFSNYINGSNKPYRNRVKPGSNGAIYSGWLLLGGYSDKAQEMASTVLKAIVEGRRNASLSYNATSYGKIAASGDISRNAKINVSSSSAPSPRNRLQ